MSELPIHEAAGHLAEVASAVALGGVLYLTCDGERIAAIVSVGLAERLERDQADAEERSRQRLADAGLLTPIQPLEGEGPSDDEFEAARARAGYGKPLSEYVSEGRGER